MQTMHFYRKILPKRLPHLLRTAGGPTAWTRQLCSKLPAEAETSSPAPPSDVVRVRFAPSPTGFMHLGGLRTALFNYLFAKSRGGKFILRIEDTDQERLVEGAKERIYEDLRWAGIEPDESPWNGGEFGPYVQSARYEVYKREIRKLMEDGRAYHCFCSERRLELLRKEAVRLRQVPKYDNKCRHLTPGQVAERLAKNDKFCIRFKVDPKADEFHDMIYGKIVYFLAQNEGDPVIIKSDGFPTYHFANVVDDHYMRITHVLRGVEWQISTPKHIQMFEAFGWRPPQYAHLPLVMNPNGSKLSKRQGDVQLDYYRRMGIFPQALLNFITQSGGGFDRDLVQVTGVQMADLIGHFDIKKINAHSSRLNPDLLKQCNREEIAHQLQHCPEKAAGLVQEVIRMVRAEYKDNLKQLDLDEKHVRAVLDWSVTRIDALQDLVKGKLSFLWVLPKGARRDKTVDADTLAALAQNLAAEWVPTFTKADLSRFLKAFAERHQLAFDVLMKSLRSCLSGLDEGPGVAEMMEILGRDKTLERMLIAAKKR